MARIRTIKPEFPQSESLGRCSRDARLLFVELWTICDDSGRTRAASRMLASVLFPYDDDSPKLIDGWLTELETNGLIVRYSSDGNSYLQVSNWLKHQKIDKPSPSKFPPPSVETLEYSTNPLESSTNPRESLPRIKEGIKEGSGDAPQTPIHDKRTDFNSSEVAHVLCDVFHWNLAGEAIRRLVREVLDSACVKWSIDPQSAAERLDAGWQAFELAQREQEPKFRKKLKGWLEQGLWAESKTPTPKTQYVAGNSEPDMEMLRRKWHARQAQEQLA